MAVAVTLELQKLLRTVTNRTLATDSQRGSLSVMTDLTVPNTVTQSDFAPSIRTRAINLNKKVEELGYRDKHSHFVLSMK